MANKLKELLNKPMPRNDQNRASLFGVVGVYLVYLAYEVLRDASNGVSQMTPTTAVACAAFLTLGGLGTIAWAIRLWRGAKKAGDTNEPEEESDEISDLG